MMRIERVVNRFPGAQYWTKPRITQPNSRYEFQRRYIQFRIKCCIPNFERQEPYSKRLHEELEYLQYSIGAS